ncbi:hypothetical protein U875_14155 [Pandoraea pnomenusa 3kgm]|uniref:hypothetical protein n=1 Tax=Pandoraea pnomenusa TaxID=93220 RepID=UPI0003C76C3E|nr:hypothetical protein [Pandoraea pnomenusa]AHB08507.1 hypothetical protein U875_14155 [Pandoraea pnomenusa 3kgm]
MSRQKKPRNKRYSPGRNGCGVRLRAELWKVAAVFGPLEQILDELEGEGTVSATLNGTPIFQDTNDGCWYEMVPALTGFIDAYEIHESRCGRAMPLEPLRLLARKLDVGMPLFDTDTVPARAALATLKAETMNMRADYARDLVQTVRIQVEQEQAREAGAP